MPKGRLIVVVGMSGIGKTVLANEIILSAYLINDGKSIPQGLAPMDPEYHDFLVQALNDTNNSTFYAKKYVTRDIRQNDVDVVKKTREEIQIGCDVVISGYKEDDLIGIDMDEILKQIDDGKTPVLATGFMELLQLILKQLKDLNRLDDVYLVGVNGFLKDAKQYVALEQGRYQSQERSSLIQSADKRLGHSRLFARQFSHSIGMFDWMERNYVIRYGHKPDLFSAGVLIQKAATIDGPLTRSDKQMRAICDFVDCDLLSFDPVRDEEIRHL